MDRSQLWYFRIISWIFSSSGSGVPGVDCVGFDAFAERVTFCPSLETEQPPTTRKARISSWMRANRIGPSRLC